MGRLVDNLGARTLAGRWLWFLTLSFRTGSHSWRRGFPALDFRPDPVFVNHFFERALSRIETEVSGPVECFRADQFGSQHGRLHLHAGLAWPDTLFPWRWKDFQQWAWQRAGFLRILPWQHAAAYYLSRYVGRAIDECHWDFSVIGCEEPRMMMPVGRQVVAFSPEMAATNVRNTLSRWHR